MEPLSDPDGDRVMKDIIPPPHKPITTELLYSDKSKLLRPAKDCHYADSTRPNWELLKNHMYREGRVSKEHC